MGDIEIETPNNKLLVLESAIGIITLLSANNIYLRDNTVYTVTLFHLILLNSLIFLRK